jgi:mandelate racemase
MLKWTRELSWRDPVGGNERSKGLKIVTPGNSQAQSSEVLDSSLPYNPGLTIRELRVRAVNVPMRHTTASGVITSAPLVLTDLITEEGVVGHSYVFTYTDMALPAVASVIKKVEELVRGDAVAPAALSHKLASNFRLLGTQGLVGIALAAIDMAAWDILARSLNVSLARLLGAEPRPLKVYTNVGCDGALDCANSAEEIVRSGRRGIKAKIGYASVEEDLEVLRAIRSAVGNGVAIMADYNGSLMPTEALERCRRLDGEGLVWIEEPVRADSYTELARIAADIQTPIQSGENWWGPNDLMKAVQAKSTDHLMPDVMKIGGVSGWRTVAAIAQVHELNVSNHIFPEISAQLMMATPTAGWLEYEEWFNPILKDPLHVENGEAVIDDRPGSGLEWDEAAVQEYLV